VDGVLSVLVIIFRIFHNVFLFLPLRASINTITLPKFWTFLGSRLFFLVKITTQLSIFGGGEKDFGQTLKEYFTS
jgi:hypothetical protein